MRGCPYVNANFYIDCYGKYKYESKRFVFWDKHGYTQPFCDVSLWQDYIVSHYNEDGADYEHELADLMDLRQVGELGSPPPPRPQLPQTFVFLFVRECNVAVKFHDSLLQKLARSPESEKFTPVKPVSHNSNRLDRHAYHGQTLKKVSRTQEICHLVL